MIDRTWELLYTDIDNPNLKKLPSLQVSVCLMGCGLTEDAVFFVWGNAKTHCNFEGVCSNASNKFHPNRNNTLSDVPAFDRCSIVKTTVDCSRTNFHTSYKELGISKL